MNSFLSQVAAYYRQPRHDKNLCFVMPTRRAVSFLRKELGPDNHTLAITIADFVKSFGHREPVNNVEALFTLYACYQRLCGGEGDPFDKFVYWGNTVLNDFNDVDMALASPEDLFGNIKDWREIATDYLTPEVKQKVEDYLNITVKSDDTPRFWKHYFPGEEKEPQQEVKERFQALWRLLLPLYNAYNDALAQRGLTYGGRLYRDAVGHIGQRRPEDFACHYAFVGFNMLSRSEHKIFRLLRDKQVASFFWDNASPAFAAKDNPGGKWVNALARELPPPADFQLEPVTAFPAIHLMGVPSRTGQAKCAFDVVDRLIDEGVITPSDDVAHDNSLHTAIVMPDEGLLTPLLNSVSTRISHLNVTMGYSMRGSDIVSLMRLVARAHRHARRVGMKNGVKQWQYYREDVKDVLSHPLIKAHFAIEAIEIAAHIDNSCDFNVSQDYLCTTPLQPLFTTIDSGGTVDGVLAYLRQHHAFVATLLERQQPVEGGDDGMTRVSIQGAFLQFYLEALQQTAQAIEAHGLPVSDDTVFHLVERLVAGAILPFEGEPLNGLQVMGLLETRCLDFDNVVVMGANEKVLPRKLRQQSLVSDVMRAIFGMLTTEHQEANWAYYFYHLIGRAKNVFLIYDSRSDAPSGGEPTRYAHQLELLYGCRLHRTIYTTSLPPIELPVIEVPKNERIMNELRRFTTTGSPGMRYLSASSINAYINCPLEFYMSAIEDLSDENERQEFMDSATFGSIVHETLQDLYYPQDNGQPRKGTYRVTASDIKRFMEHDMQRAVQRHINDKYLHRPPQQALEPLTGEAAIMAETVGIFVQRVLDHDLQNVLGGDTAGFFEVQECERKELLQMQLGQHTINFTYLADRIDRVNNNPELRIIDYKTGGDETAFSSIDDLFAETPSKKRCKAILQLMLYCNAYATQHGGRNSGNILVPLIYRIAKMDETGLFYRKDPMGTYDTVNEEFLQQMGRVIDEMMDPSVPFTQTKIPPGSPGSPCSYCRFADICHRN